MDAFPIPRIEEVLDDLQNSSYLSTLDLASGYWQVELDKEAIPKTAFCPSDGLCKFLRMPFKLKGAPTMFQRLMQRVLEGLNLMVAIPFLDDVIVHSSIFNQHLVDLQRVFQRQTNAGLTLQPSKCTLVAREVLYLEHIIGEHWIKPTETGIVAVVDYPTPRDLAALRCFLGLVRGYGVSCPTSRSPFTHSTSSPKKKERSTGMTTTKWPSRTSRYEWPISWPTTA